MTSSAIKIPLSVSGIERAIQEVEAYQEWLKRKSEEFLDRLVDKGLRLSQAKFQKAVYDGTNDVKVQVEQRGKNCRAVVAVGNSVLFIEFGTGVVYPDNHPEAAIHGMRRGSYGHGRGSQPVWGYYGDPGTNGQAVKETDYGTLVLTSGNPANMPMYTTVKELKEMIRDIALEVFQR